jgi:hypothetical protein
MIYLSVMTLFKISYTHKFIRGTIEIKKDINQLLEAGKNPPNRRSQILPPSVSRNGQVILQDAAVP